MLYFDKFYHRFHFMFFERYFFHHWAWLNMFMTWWIYDVIIYCITNTVQTSENIYHIYLWHTKCLNLEEVRWSLWHMMYVMYTELLHYIYKPVGKVLLYMYMYNMYNIYIYKYIYIYIYIYNIYIYPAFRPLGRCGESPPPSKNLLIYPTPHQKSIQPNKKMKTSFLAVVIAPVPFLF